MGRERKPMRLRGIEGARAAREEREHSNGVLYEKRRVCLVLV